MKIEKAIEEIRAWQSNKGNPSYDKLNEALDLGIEALKRIKERRDLGTGWEVTPLPGETEE